MNTEYIPTNDFIVRRPYIDYKDKSLDYKALNNLIRQPFFQEAIYYSSIDLYSELIKHLHGEISEKDANKMISTIYKYAQRMHYRCTPFGMFAYCGVGNYSEKTYVPEQSNIMLHYRYDCQFLYDYLKYLLKSASPNLISSLVVYSNQTIFPVSEYYHLTVRNHEDGSLSEIKVLKTEILDFILNCSKDGIRCQHIIERCIDCYDIEIDELNNYIKNLILQGLLITNIQVETTGEDNFSRIKKNLEVFNVPLLKDMENNIGILNSDTSFEIKQESIGRLVENASRLGIQIKKNQVIQVDAYSTSPVQINKNVKSLLSEWFNILKSITPSSDNPMSNFVYRFYNRYEDMRIPLLRVLNKHTGIGYYNYQYEDSQIINNINKIPRAISNYVQIHSYHLSVLEQIILDCLNELSSPVKILDLTHADFKKYGQSEIHDDSISYYCMYDIVGYNDNGPILNRIHFSGPSASCLLTRFADGLEDILNVTLNIAEKEKLSNESIILAEIAHLARPHSGNVQIRPSLRNYEIPYLSFPNKHNTLSINLSDLMVSVLNGKVKLFSKKYNKEVIPCFSSAFNYKYNTSELYQFLGDIQNQNSSRLLSSNFGSLLSLLKHIPRIIYKNIIVSPESWMIKNTWKNVKDVSHAIQNIRCLHESLKMPKFLSFNQGDNYYVVDIQSDISVQGFINLTRSQNNIIRVY